MAKYCPPGSVLDVGAAGGFTLAAFREMGWTTFGVEPNSTMAAHARDRMALDVETAAFETWTGGRSFDLVTMLQVLPHFVDPRQAIAKASGLVAPGGHLLIETWNRASWTARWFGQAWHEYSPPSVLHWFTRAGLARMAHGARLEPVASGRAPKWISAAHAKELLNHKADQSPTTRLLAAAARLVPDRAALPYPLDDLFWLLLRKE
jgi:SAM-dependent methyltransferase